MNGSMAVEVGVRPGSDLLTMDTTYAAEERKTTILCCLCGVPIVASDHPTRLCLSCLAGRADLTRGISTEVTLHQCRGCQRWHRDGGSWMACELESRELMGLCLAKTNGLKRRTKKGGGGGVSGKSKHSADGDDDDGPVRLTDAGWIWTEPHSMRLKVRLTVQREMSSSTSSSGASGPTVLQQSFVVVYVVRNQQCTECQAAFRQGTWKSSVQLRQRSTASHRRTLLYLEQLILKHGAHRGCLSVETFRDGMDFYFPDRSLASRFVSFVDSHVPIVKTKHSKKLVSTDDRNNVANYKHTTLMELCPLCRDDLLRLPKNMAFPPLSTVGGSGNADGSSGKDAGRLALVHKVSRVLHIIDPLTGRTAVIHPETYSKDPESFRPLVAAARSRFTRYLVLDSEPVVLTEDLEQGLNNNHNNDGGTRRAKGRKRGQRRKRDESISTDRHDDNRSTTTVTTNTTTQTKGSRRNKPKKRLTEVTLTRESDLGHGCDRTVVVRSHVGYLLKAGDVCIGYNLADLQTETDLTSSWSSGNGSNNNKDNHDVVLPDAIPVRKLYGAAAGGEEADKKRIFRVERLPAENKAMDVDKKKGDVEDDDEEDFLREVEADREMRANMNLYRVESASSKAGTVPPPAGTSTRTVVDQNDCHDDDDDDDDQRIRLDELVEKLDLDDGPDENGVAMGIGTTGLPIFAAEGERAAKDGLSYTGRDEARTLPSLPNNLLATSIVVGTLGRDFVAEHDIDL